MARPDSEPTPPPDPQRDKVYAFQDGILRKLWGGVLNPHEVCLYVEELRCRYLPDEELRVDFTPRDWIYEDYPELRVGRPVAFFLSQHSPREILFVFGEKIGWIKKHVLHEFAHAVVHFTRGDHLEPHGPEFLGIFCHLMSEAFRFHPMLFVNMADDLGMRVVPYEPPSKRKFRRRKAGTRRRATSRP